MIFGVILAGLSLPFYQNRQILPLYPVFIRLPHPNLLFPPNAQDNQKITYKIAFFAQKKLIIVNLATISDENVVGMVDVALPDDFFVGVAVGLEVVEAAVVAIITANPAQVEKAQKNPKLAGWFVGQVMKATGGKANPAAVNALVKEKLGL